MFSMTSAKETVAFTSILASGLLTVLKLTVGLLTGSLGILSEAAHSALDCAGTVLTFIAIRIGDKPPDDDHPTATARSKASRRWPKRRCCSRPAPGSSPPQSSA